MARNSHIDPNLPKAKINAKTLNSLFSIFKLADKKDQWLFVLGTFFLLLTALASLVFPGLSGQLIDTANGSIEDIDKAALPFILLFAAQSLFAFLRIYIFVYVTEKIIFKLRTKLFESVITKKYAFFTENRAGEITSRFGSDISQIQDAFTTHIAHLFRQVIVIVGGLSIMLYQYFAMAKFMLWIIPVVILVAMFFGKFIRKFSRKVQDQTAETNTVVDESIQAIHNVKSFANEWFELIRFQTSAEEIRKLATKRGLFRALFSAFIIICLFGAIVILIWQAIKLVKLGEITMGDMSAFLIYNAVVAGAIGGLAEKYLQVQKSLGSIDRVLEIIEEDSEEIDLDKQQKMLPIKGDVAFENVSFSYDKRNENKVLSNISFTANTGETIAIVGPSGAGKSTLVTLLMKFYDADKGVISVDGKSINDYTLSEYRNIFAMVPQEIVLFGGSIKDNIAYGKPDASMAEIEAAAQKANAIYFINNFPDKFETLVGDRGIKLSGGQKQRIAIARAVLKNPSILLLDEATSSLDSLSENEVQKALDSLMQGRTSFVIAHRLSTIKNADKILVLNNGEIVQQGNYAQLMKEDKGLFKELVDMQAVGV